MIKILIVVNIIFFLMSLFSGLIKKTLERSCKLVSLFSMC